MDTFLPRVATAAAALLAVTALAGCGSSGGSASASSSSSSSSSTSGSSTPGSGGSSTTAELTVASSSLGEVVVNGSKMTTYVFTKDKPGSGTSSCTGQCAALWPPVTTTGTPKVDGVKGTVGTISLPDGSKQVTLDGRPLYLFSKDSKPGDVSGQGIGSVWYAVGPDGSMLTGGGTRGGY